MFASVETQPDPCSPSRVSGPWSVLSVWVFHAFRLLCLPSVCFLLSLAHCLLFLCPFCDFFHDERFPVLEVSAEHLLASRGTVQGLLKRRAGLRFYLDHVISVGLGC